MILAELSAENIPPLRISLLKAVLHYSDVRAAKLRELQLQNIT
jgi:hypothetical protein